MNQGARDANQAMWRREVTRLLEIAARCNEPIVAWRGPDAGRCEFERGHRGECGRKHGPVTLSAGIPFRNTNTPV